MRNKVIGGLTAIILLLIIYISINSYFSVFTTEKWEKYPSMRIKMVGSMFLKNFNENNFENTTREEVINVLGNPDYSSNEYFSYNISGKFSDWGLDFHTDTNGAVNYYKVRIP